MRPETRRWIIAIGCGVVLVVAAIAFMTYDLRGSLDFALRLRGRKLAAMLMVGTGLGTATVLFHTVSENRILTPSLMGFDAVYIFVQVGAATTIGTTAFLRIDERLLFAGQVAVLVGFALALNAVFLRRVRVDVGILLLAGIVIGGIFRSLGELLARLLDPNEFIVVQDRLFASFSSVNDQLLAVSGIAIVAVLVYVWRIRQRLDVLALGREHALTLGVDVDRNTRVLMAVIAILVAVPTALVGPFTFLGLLAANVAYVAAGTFRHRWSVPLSAMFATTALVAAQFVLEELLGFGVRVSVIVAFVGGIAFIALVLRAAATSNTQLASGGTR